MGLLTSIDIIKFHKQANQLLAEEYLEKHETWASVSRYGKLSEDFIREYQDKVHWGWVSRCQTLSEDFIREFQDRVDWLWISDDQKLSESFIREFKDKINWESISSKQVLSEDFIREFQDEVVWIWMWQRYKLKKEDFMPGWKGIEAKLEEQKNELKFIYGSAPPGGVIPDSEHSDTVEEVNFFKKLAYHFVRIITFNRIS